MRKALNEIDQGYEDARKQSCGVCRHDLAREYSEQINEEVRKGLNEIYQGYEDARKQSCGVCRHDLGR